MEKKLILKELKELREELGEVFNLINSETRTNLKYDNSSASIIENNRLLNNCAEKLSQSRNAKLYKLILDFEHELK